MNTNGQGIDPQIQEQESRYFKKYSRILWLLFASGICAIMGIFVLASYDFFGDMPTFEVLENPNTNLASEILSDDGQVLGKIYDNDNRTFVQYEDLSKHLIDALIATEDERFFKHSGIDFIGTLRAFFFLGNRGGGSTITQQLARQLFVGVRSRNIFKAVFQKIKEWIIALRLERNYTKSEIITMYYNIYDFSNNADGIKSAARIYFNTEPSKLNIEQACMLVGMFKNSSLYNPRSRHEITKKRRNVIINQIYKKGIITLEEKDSLHKLEMVLDFYPESHDVGIATYFRRHIKKEITQWVKNNPKPDGTFYNLYVDGLKIHTTINYNLQKYAENAVLRHMKNVQKVFNQQNELNNAPFAPFDNINQEEVDKIIRLTMKRSERWRHLKYDLKKTEEEIIESFYKKEKMSVFSWSGDIDTILTPLDSIWYYKKFLHTGMVSIEPSTGHVKTWVGDINFKHFKYDHVIQGARQTGSTFKPFVYATAIDQLHLSPCDKFPDVQHCIEAGKYGNIEAWCPKNSNSAYSGKMKTLKTALANSINTITTILMDKVGPKPVVELTKKLGVKSNILPVPSIALGSADVKLFEMVAAYATFSNEGIYTKPVLITQIDDKNGTTLYRHTPVVKDVLSKEVAYTVINLLTGVTQSGSGQRLRTDFGKSNAVYKDIITGYPYNFKNPIAGKTGTTQNNSDAWFMGIVPNLVTGVWVGGEDRSIHFKSTLYGQGASLALPIWALFMKQCYDDPQSGVSKEDFKKPEDFNVNIHCFENNDYEDRNKDPDFRGFEF